MTAQEVADCLYSLPQHFEPKRIGDMDREELLQVIAGLRGSERWWANEAKKPR